MCPRNHGTQEGSFTNHSFFSSADCCKNSVRSCAIVCCTLIFHRGTARLTCDKTRLNADHYIKSQTHRTLITALISFDCSRPVPHAARQGTKSIRFVNTAYAGRLRRTHGATNTRLRDRPLKTNLQSVPLAGSGVAFTALKTQQLCTSIMEPAGRSYDPVKLRRPSVHEADRQMHPTCSPRRTLTKRNIRRGVSSERRSDRKLLRLGAVRSR